MLIDELPGTPLLLKEPSDQQLGKSYEMYTEMLCTLREIPFDQIGCHSLKPKGNVCVGPIMGNRTGTLSQMVPFYNAREYYSTYLKYKANAGRWNAFESDLDDGEYNITGIIDWTFTRVAPAFEAFGPSLSIAEMGDI
ncbi:hypothetical protein BBP40_009235 [Aspergillus hancockii]|nr:hypothetical protein BBP40_009235 [Aspergillus hancockii]